MPNRSLILQQNTFYHVYNRGCDKQQIFFEDRDYQRFLNNILRFREPCPHIYIPTWCLLPNHFHFILIESSELDSSPSNLKKNKQNMDITNGGAKEISLFMQKLQQAYAAFFNTKYLGTAKKKKGPVFEGRFRIFEAPDEAYLTHLKDYVEYNPVKHGLVKSPAEWEYSSFGGSFLDSPSLELDSYPLGDTNPKNMQKDTNPKYDFGSFDPFFD